MLRNKSSSAMQKTYDDCYLICSTAVYFEGQNNEAEALRSWRSALDQIYYHNAYKTPPNYVPKNETERALMESLRNMELQCKERVEILDALRKSRKEADKSRHSGDASVATSTSQSRHSVPHMTANTSSMSTANNWMGDGTVPPLSNTDLPRAAPPLPQRPTPVQKAADIVHDRPHSTPQFESLAPPPPSAGQATLPVPPKKTSRTPSPDKKGGRVMLTTLRGPKDSKGRPTKPTKLNSGRRDPPPASSKAAGLAWDTTPKFTAQKGSSSAALNTTSDSQQQEQLVDTGISRNGSLSATSGGSPVALPDAKSASSASYTPPDLNPTREPLGPRSFETARKVQTKPVSTQDVNPRPHISSAPAAPKPAPPSKQTDIAESKPKPKPAAEYPSYRTEFPPTAPSSKATAEFNARIARREESPKATNNLTRHRSPQRKPKDLAPNGIKRKPMAVTSSPRPQQQDDSEPDKNHTSESGDDHKRRPRATAKRKGDGPSSRSGSIPLDPALSTEDDSPKTWEDRVKWIRKNLPKGVDEGAAKQIFNEIVVRGDEVHWADVAGLDTAKTALKEAVVYPFLRPDLFMGLREPARGMLLFGPPGTGKTMLARAVATESQSTFFAISASSLTSKWLGESEKLVRALFLLAKALAPSIIFVDEIDSLLSSRGGSSEHETTRRIKTEFLIQWSDLQRAAAGSKQSDKDKTEGDATRVLVLAATNMPWAIDEAARRRFVRRQYIPLPEASVRAEQLRTLLGHQKHSLNRKDIQVLVELTDGFSGSDITALAKDAAMGPLRSLGEALLYMSMDEIRPINFSDFESSLLSIRPSVNKQGLQEYENWAKEFGERGV